VNIVVSGPLFAAAKALLRERAEESLDMTDVKNDGTRKVKNGVLC
jgi:hypothetical protein